MLAMQGLHGYRNIDDKVCPKHIKLWEHPTRTFEVHKK